MKHLRLIGFMVSMLVFMVFPAFAQVVDPNTNIITTQGAAWFALVALVAALGIPFTSRAVDFVLLRPWAAFIKGDWIILLSLGFATGWTLFMFQPGLLNITAFTLLPTWQSIVAVSIAIAIAASGGKDSQTRAKQKELEMGLPQ
jgi:hypothetical protein